MQKPNFALVRDLPLCYGPSYPDLSSLIDMDLALHQRSLYSQALTEAGLTLERIPADENCYDCVFVEDTAVVWQGAVLITRMQSHRQHEHSPVRDFFASRLKVYELQNPKSLIEGGDVLQTEDVTYVGLSSRTNHSGIEELREFLSPFGREVRVVPVEKCLHLKTGATYLGHNHVLVAPQLISSQYFDIANVIECAPGEENAANCIRVGNHLLISGRYRKTAEKLNQFASAHALKVIELDMSEFEKGDGSLTCLSIIY